MTTLIEIQEDVRLDESQLAIMRQMMADGMDEREAKLRVLNIAKPPDHFQRIVTNYQQYPKMVYHPDGRHRVARDTEEHKAANVAGWLDQPLQIHMDKFQEPNKKQLHDLEIELENQLASVRRQQGGDSPEVSIHPGAQIAVDKQRKVDAARTK